MEVRWNPPQPQLKILKQTSTYITYYTKYQIFSQIVDKSNNPVEWPTLLFENNVYVGPEHDYYKQNQSYTNQEIAEYTTIDCKKFQHPTLQKILWNNYC